MGRPKKTVITERPSDPFAAAFTEHLSREKETIGIYRPGNDKQQSIHANGALTSIVEGANRSGKTVTTAVEIASRLTGERVIGYDDQPIPARFPIPNNKRKFVYWMIGYDHNHIGQTLYRVFFEPGLFDIIWDNEKGRYASFNETNPDHKAREDEKEPAPPLIPARLIKQDSWSWHEHNGGKQGNCFSSVELTNGAVIYTFPSSTTQPKMGDPVDGLFIDEDVKHGGHVAEYIARLADRSGWFIWAAWPKDNNYVLTNLKQGCEQAMEEDDDRFFTVTLEMTENPYFADAKKSLQVDRFSMLGDEDVVDSRVRGIQGYEGRMMYDFIPMVHGVSSEYTRNAVPELDSRTRRGVLQAIYRDQGMFPTDWTRYFAIDPSTQRSAVLFGVCPPPEVQFGNYSVTMPPTLIVENELVLRRSTPDSVAMGCKEIVGLKPYEAFIIDRNFGRQKHFSAAGRETWEVLAEAFKKHGLSSRLTQNWFIPGCNIPEDRAAVVRQMLDGGVTNDSAVYFVLDRTVQTQKEFQGYYKKLTEEKSGKVVHDVPENPRKFDCMAALEYLSHYVFNLMKMKQHYVEPKEYQGDSAYQNLAKALNAQDEQDEYIHLGPGTAA